VLILKQKVLGKINLLLLLISEAQGQFLPLLRNKIKTEKLAVLTHTRMQFRWLMLSFTYLRDNKYT
jgi:hypothetical protein